MGKINDVAVKGLAGLILVGTLTCSAPCSKQETKEPAKQESRITKENTPTYSPYFNSRKILTIKNAANEKIRRLINYPINTRPNMLENINLNSIMFKRTLSRKEISNLVSKIYTKIGSKRKIPPYMSKKFFEDVILVESSRDVYAKSPDGARGLMQLMRNAWEQVETDDSLIYKEPKEPYSLAVVPEKNIENGIKYYLWINSFCSRNYPNWNELSQNKKIDILHASYNVGATKLEKLCWDISQTNSETRTHVARLDSLASS